MKKRIIVGILCMLVLIVGMIILSSCSDPCSHEWSERTVKTAAACTEEGPRSAECINCGNVKSESVSALGHSCSWVAVVDKTYTADKAVAHYHCDACGSNFDGDKNAIDSIVISACHEYNTVVWGYKDQSGHAHRFVLCQGHDTLISHTPGEEETATTPRICTVCSYIITPATVMNPTGISMNMITATALTPPM